MNVLLLNYEYPPIGAGAGVISFHIAEGLAAKKHNVTVITTWFHGEQEDEKKPFLRIIRLRSKRKKIYGSNIFEMLSWSKKTKEFLSDFCTKNNFDICFANFALPGGEVALYLKHKFQIPFVILSHGHDIQWFFPKQMFVYHLFTYKKIKNICLSSEANFIQTVAMKKNIDRFLGKNNEEINIIIPNGSDYKTFKPDYSKQPAILKILFVGRLVKQKDPFTFLKAIKIFSSTNDNFIVHIVGNGPLREEMEYFVNRNDLHEKIKFLGWMNNENLIGEYQSSHVKIAPSLEEGMSISTMESIACGQYVITTPVSENRNLIQNNINGNLINTKDYKEIAYLLQQYYSEKFATGYKIPEDYLREFQKKYNWENIIEQYENTLLNLLQVKQ